jgi:hypothetical protein
LAGNIAHAAVFAKALTAAQVQALYSAASIVPSVTLNVTGGPNTQLTWSQGTLLQSTNVSGPWITNATSSPYPIVPTNSQMFYKVLVN